MNTRTIFFLALQGVACLIFVLFLSNWVFPLTTDSLIYITTAKNIIAFKGMTFANFFVQPATPDFLPVMLEPPGYPMLIVILKLLGIDEYTGAVLLPRLFLLFLPFLFFIIFRKIVPSAVALIAAFVCTFMFSTIKSSLIAWTDVPYLFFSLVSIALAFRMVEKEGKVGILFIFFSGIITGYAFFIRYIGLTLITSIVCGWTLCNVLRIIPFKNLLRILCVYGSGMALVVLPFVVRNKIVFGTIQPYQMPPSESSLSVNIHDYLQGLAQMIFASRSFEIIVFLMIAFLIISFFIRAKDWIRHDKKLFVYAFIVIIYFIFNSLFLIAYKTFCYGSEEINERYLIQIAWILMGGLVYVIHVGLKRLNNSWPLDIKSVTGLLLLSFFLIQIFSVVDFYYFNKRINALCQKIEHYIPLVRDLPADYVIVSNVADITYYFAKRNVRMLANYTPYGLVKILGEKRKFAVFLIKEDEFSSRAWYYSYVWKSPAYGYRMVFSDKNIDFLVPGSQY